MESIGSCIGCDKFRYTRRLGALHHALHAHVPPPPLKPSLVIGGSGGGGSERKLQLPNIFGEGMVLQQGKPLSIWGWAAPGVVVEVSLGDSGAAASDTAGDDGKWSVYLPPQATNAVGQTLKACSGDDTVEMDDCHVGEVWVSSLSVLRWLPNRCGPAIDIAADRFNRHAHHYMSQLCSGQSNVSDPITLEPATVAFQLTMPVVEGKLNLWSCRHSNRCRWP